MTRAGVCSALVLLMAVALAPSAAAERPSSLLPPTVEGTLRVGEILLASPGLWKGTDPLRFTNRWERCDPRLCTFTGDTIFLYRVRETDVGKRMRARITVSNSDGSVSSFTPQSAIVRPRLRLLEPFPVIAIRGFITRRGVSLRRLAVRAPRGSRVVLTCRGRGCPYRSARTRLRTSLLTVKRLLRRSLAPGTVIELRVTGRDRVGKYTRFRILRNRKPARIDRCLIPGTSRPSRCPPEE